MLNRNDIIGLDFETYSAVDLKRHGLHRYVSSSTFTPLIASHTWYSVSGLDFRFEDLDFIADFDGSAVTLEAAVKDRYVAAHNAGFEQRVLSAIGIDLPSSQFIDSAVVARAAGAAGKLEAAAPQLLGMDKLEEGARLIKLFCVPGPLQAETDCLGFDKRIIEQHPDEWALFKKYCQVDSHAGLKIARNFEHLLSDEELRNQAVTMDMNNTGWCVDVPMVEEMQRRYLENQEQALADFRATHGDVNLNSLKQMKEFCAERGIRATSFDEKHVAKLIERIRQKLDDFDMAIGAKAKPGQYEGYCEVLALLETKQTLGGSSLKKLQVILDTTGKDCRLRDQYLHIGAGQTWRTTGRSVQMQNLKRLDSDNIADMAELEDLDSEWDNEKLAENIRQCFTASHPQGQLIVGDFSSVESRGLAWLAGEQWKLDGYKHGQDMYKVLAAKIYGTDYYDVTKAQRQTGKVGELSCGYGAGGGAVQAFAENMGVTFTEGEAAQLVSDWRAANPLIVKFWADLDEALNSVLDGAGRYGTVRVGPDSSFRVTVYREPAPASLQAQHPNAVSIRVDVEKPNSDVMLSRVFHGCYRRGRNICYYKPSERKTGDLWSSHFTDPKTKQVKFYSIYGGKLAGILTQSFCRELFFTCLRRVHAWVGPTDNLQLVGQFHDEIVLDWQPPAVPSHAPVPGQITLENATLGLKRLMSDAGDITGFPLEADIKHDYRYTK